MSDVEGREQAFAIVKRFLADRVAEALDDEIDLEIRHLGREPYTLDSVTISTKAALDPSSASEIVAIASDQAELCATERSDHRFLVRTLGSIGGVRFGLRTAQPRDEDLFDDGDSIATSQDPIVRWMDLLVLQERSAQIASAHDRVRRDKLLDALQTMLPQVLPLILGRIGGTNTVAPMSNDERSVLDRIIDGVSAEQIQKVADSGLLTAEQMIDLGRLWTLNSARRYGPTTREASPKETGGEPTVTPYPTSPESPSVSFVGDPNGAS